MVERTWYYYNDTIQVGPVTESVLRGLITNGKLPNTALVHCSEVSDDWTVAAETEAFQNLGSATADFVPDNPPPQIANARNSTTRARRREFLI